MTEWLSHSSAPEDSERIGADIRRVVDMFWEAIPPGRAIGADDKSKWEWVGPALLAKAATTAESMLLLLPEGREVDAFALLRVLFENAVVFSYVAINPGERLRKMWASFYRQELKEHNDWRGSGMPLLTDADIAEIRRWLQGWWPREDHENVTKSLNRHALKSVEDMATYADRYWARKFDGWRADARVDVDRRAALSSLRGLYRYIYRRGSQAAHTHHRGLDPFVTFQEAEVVVHREAAPDGLLTWNLALMVLVIMSGPAQKTLGAPSHDVVRAVLEGYH